MSYLNKEMLYLNSMRKTSIGPEVKQENDLHRILSETSCNSRWGCKSFLAYLAIYTIFNL